MDNQNEKQGTVLAISIEEAGKQLNLARCSMYKLARSDGFPAVRIGGRIVIPVKELREWLSEQVKKQKGEPK